MLSATATPRAATCPCRAGQGSRATRAGSSGGASPPTAPRPHHVPPPVGLLVPATPSLTLTTDALEKLGWRPPQCCHQDAARDPGRGQQASVRPSDSAPLLRAIPRVPRGHRAPPTPPRATRALPSGGHRHGGLDGREEQCVVHLSNFAGKPGDRGPGTRELLDEERPRPVPPRQGLGPATPRTGRAAYVPRPAVATLVQGTRRRSLTTVQLFGGDGGHRAPLDAARIFTGGRCLRIPRLGVGFEQIRQPQDLTVAVKRVGVQSPDGRKTVRRGHRQVGPRTPAAQDRRPRLGGRAP